MHLLDRLAVALSLTKAEISVISLLLVFALLGNVAGNFRAARDADELVRQREHEELSDREADSLLAAAKAIAAEEGESPPGKHEAAQAGASHTPVKTTFLKGKRSTSRSGKKRFSGTVALNKATEQQLQQIPGIGPVMAKRLVAFRKLKAGRIERYEELLEVNGIGEKKLQALKKYLTLD